MTARDETALRPVTVLRVVLAFGVAAAVLTWLDGRWGQHLVPSALRVADGPWEPIVVAFQTRWIACLAVAVPVCLAVPPPARSAVLACIGGVFLAVSVTPVLAVASVIEALLLHAALHGARRRPARGALHGVVFGALLVAFYAWMGRAAIGTPLTSPIDLLASAQGFVTLGILTERFKRSFSLWLEAGDASLRAGISFTDLAAYLFGLPLCGIFSVVPSFRHFRESRLRVVDEGVSRGAASLAACSICLLAWAVGMRALAAVGLTGQTALPMGTAPLATVWTVLGLHYVLIYLYRLAVQEVSVGAARLVGHDLRSNFDAPLASDSVVAFWRRWNTHWRETLLRAAYTPVALSLARRAGASRPLHHLVAALAAFLLGSLFNILPLALFLPLRFLPVVAASWVAYDGLCGLLVGLDLAGRRAGLRACWPRPLAIVVTFATVALCRVLIWHPMETLSSQIQVLLHALGLRPA